MNRSFLLMPNRSRTRPSRLVAGLALSLALHAALLLAWRQGRIAAAPMTAPRTSIAARLRPPPPPLPKAEPAPARRSTATALAAARPQRRTAPDVIALAPPAPDGFTVEQPAPSESPLAPRFDAVAARQQARQLANVPDPARAGTALAQLPPRPLETDTRAARAISRAKRRDCKDGIPGGLLAPLLLMMDKKDSGCQW